MSTGGGKPGSCGCKANWSKMAFARPTGDVRQAGLVSGGYPDPYLLDLGLLRCWSWEVGPKVLGKLKMLSAKRGEREHI